MENDGELHLGAASSTGHGRLRRGLSPHRARRVLGRFASSAAGRPPWGLSATALASCALLRSLGWSLGAIARRWCGPESLEACVRALGPLWSPGAPKRPPFLSLGTNWG